VKVMVLMSDANIRLFDYSVLALQCLKSCRCRSVSDLFVISRTGFAKEMRHIYNQLGITYMYNEPAKQANLL
jgi:hypothetical protein